MPRVTSVEALAQAATGFVVDDVDLAVEPAAAAAAQRSLNDSDLLLLGEMHGSNHLFAKSAEGGRYAGNKAPSEVVRARC
jgi:hypothetical protein